MKCELCGKAEPETFVLLPIKKPDGCLNTIACLECSENSPHYCKKHQRPHLGFEGDDTTACIVCIEETVKAEKSKESFIFDTLQKELPEQEFQRLLEWAEISASITDNSQVTCVLRAIVTKALRIKQSIETVMEKIIAEKSVDFIL